MSDRSATGWAGASTRLRAARGVVVLVVLLVAAGLTSATFAQGTSAVVEGAARVNVRRGPGQNFPKVATIGAGERVDVEGMEGEWAHIRTAGGKKGYVRSVFLAPPREPRRAAPGVAPVPHETPPGRAADAGEGGRATASVPVDASPTARHGGAPGATPAAQPSATVQSAEMDAETARRLQAELTRVTAELEALRGQVEKRGTESVPMPGGTLSGGTVGDAAEQFGAGTLGVVVIALLAGWLAGMAVGRRQERKRRSRIRF